jgi:MFS family permease
MALPSVAFGLYGGVLADRLPRRNLIIAAQVLAMLQAFALAALTLTGHITPGYILVLSFLLGLVQAFELPARHSFVSQLVPRADLPNAIALNASLFQLSRFIGPALAGVLVVWISEGWVFFINGLTFIAVLLGLHAMRLPATSNDTATVGVNTLGEGVGYVWRHPRIRAVIALVVMIALFGNSVAVLMPVFAVKVFASDAHSLGALLSAIGAGAFVGAILLARRREHIGLEPAIAAAGLGAGVAIALFAATRSLTLALIVLPVAGFCITTALASSNTLIQLEVPDHLRGRVMALFTIAAQGIMPLGQFAVGAAADIVGARFTVATCGVFLFLAAATFALVIRRAR